MSSQEKTGSNTLPLYQQVMEDIKRKIESGIYPQNSCIKGEKELIAEYQVSRITVRRAVEELCTQGYLVKHQGVGTFVSKPKFRRLISKMASFTESCEEIGAIPTRNLLRLIIIEARADEIEFFKLPPNGKLIYSSRILSADQIPIMYENCYYPFSERFQFLLEENLEGSLFALLKERGIEPVHAQKRTLEIVTATKKHADLLRIKEGEPLFYKNTYLLDEDYQPLYIERSYIVGSRYVFDIPDFRS